MKTTLEKQFAGLVLQRNKMESTYEANSGAANDAYWKERENFEANLKGFINGTEFTELPKSKFFILCDMVSTFRPVPLHSFLISIANRKKLSKSTERKGPR